MRLTFCCSLLLVLTIFAGCAGEPAPVINPRESSIPAGAIKMTPEMDFLPPVLHSSDYYEPVPLNAAINTAGGEDSPFITDDASALYFFFTPDVNVSPEVQIRDGVTGLYVSYYKDNKWGMAQRILLQDGNKLALDGAEYVRGNEMWFASIREGNYRMIDVWIADYIDGRWTNWRNAGKKLNQEFQIGEFHITADGNELYFHSDKAGGKGDKDIWVTRKVNGEWQTPENVTAVNTSDMEGWPFVTADGNELWFTRTYLGTPAIFVSRKKDGQWSAPELIISQFAGEPSIDAAGNIYFVHHFYHNNKMIEADIYVAYHK
ncbi:MAG: TolB family protein [Dehalococcoidales bacterium]